MVGDIQSRSGMLVYATSRYTGFYWKDFDEYQDSAGSARSLDAIINRVIVKLNPAVLSFMFQRTLPRMETLGISSLLFILSKEAKLCNSDWVRLDNTHVLHLNLKARTTIQDAVRKVTSFFVFET